MSGPPVGGGAPPQPVATKVVRELDRWLFVPDRWFAIDEHNAAAAGVVVASLEHGLELAATSDTASGGGRRLTFAGRLRPEAVAVDVDAAGVVGDAIVEHLVSWCVGRGLWHLVRPSGGSDGRAHVLIVPAGFVADLEAYTRQLRADYRTTGPAVDVRGGRYPQKALRPLSAPHRSGRTTRPLGPLTRLLAELRQVLPTPPPPADRRRRRRPSRGERPELQARPRAGNQHLGVKALAAAQRVRRELPGAWAAHLQAGKAAPVSTLDRSEVELRATAVLLRSGLDAAGAWSAIADSPDHVMEKAKTRGQQWWTRHVWNAAVRTDLAHRAAHPAPARPQPPRTSPARGADREPDPDPAIQSAVSAARDALTVLQWRISPRRRSAVLLVAHTLLDRMAREAVTTVPCPLRNLLLDTGLSLKTVSGALNGLDGLLGRRATETFDPTRRDSSSHTFVLDPRFGELFTTNGTTKGGFGPGMSQSPTPVSHTPSRPSPLPRGTWSHLGPGCHAAWRVLINHPEGLSAGSVARQAGLASGPSAELSARQARTLRSHLRDLAAAGLARVDVQGQWQPLEHVTSVCRAAAVSRYERFSEQVTVERAAYRAGGIPSASWRRGRDRALQRQSQVDHVRQQRWFAGLSPDERAARQEKYAARFLCAPPVEQSAWKNDWATRRSSQGMESEHARHDRWLQTLSNDEYARRAAERAFAFSQLASPLQVALAEQWQAHRTVWKVPCGPPAATHSVLDDLAAGIGRDARDEAHLKAERPPTLPLTWDGRSTG